METQKSPSDIFSSQIPIDVETLHQATLALTSESLAQWVQTQRKEAQIPSQLQRVARLSAPLVECVGTGGNPTEKPSLSTLTTLLAPLVGLTAIKHGGRSSRGRTGSIDFLENLGLSPTLCFEGAAEHLRLTGCAFLPAALVYPSFRRFVDLRKEYARQGLGLSVFNFLGPLLTPVPTDFALLGASTPSAQSLLAGSLCALGRRGAVVCGQRHDARSEDEASLHLPFSIHLVQGGEIVTRTFPALIPLDADALRYREELFAAPAALTEAFLNGDAEAGCGFLLSDLSLNLALLHEGLEGRLLSLSADQLRHVALRLRERLAFCLGKSFALHLTTLKTALSPHPRSPLVAREAHHLVQTNAPAFAPRKEAFQAVLRAGEAVLAEVKAATPREGRMASSLPLESRLEAYRAASALSVVTHPRFEGSLDLLRHMRRQCPNTPLLAKDFVSTREEIQALVHAGADGVLILADDLSPSQTSYLAAETLAMGALPVVETLCGEIDTPLPREAALLLNSRNLVTLHSAPAWRARALPRLVRDGRPLIVASDIQSPLEARVLLGHAQAVLIGSHLMGLEHPKDIEAFLQTATSKRPLLKICGAASFLDVQVALEHGADLVGINLIPSSRRFLPLPALQDLLAAASSVGAHLVALTAIDTPLSHIEALHAFPLGFEQAYGLPHFPRALQISPKESQQALAALQENGLTPGSGRHRTPHPVSHPRTWLAGGITPSNASISLLAGVGPLHTPFGLDVASGAESPNATPRQRFSAEAIHLLRHALDAFSKDAPL